MGRILAVAGKDLKLLWRDKSSLFWVLIFPLLIAVLFGSIFGGEGKSSPVKIAVVDQDRTPESAAFAARLRKNTGVAVKDSEEKAAREAVRTGSLTAFILLPAGYGEAVNKFNPQGSPIRVGIDPSRKAEAGILQGVIAEAAYGGISERFSDPSAMQKSARDAIAQLPKGTQGAETNSTRRFLQELDRFSQSGAIQSNSKHFSFQGPKIEQEGISQRAAGPASSYEVTFPQALVWALLGVVTTFAITLVKERQQGTLLRLRVSPLSQGKILGGKGVACFATCAAVMLALLIVARIIFGVRLDQPLLLLMAIGSASLCFVGIMMLLSVLGRTEQAVAGSSWGVMILMAMFGGGMIPLFMMPGWMQTASHLSPIKWSVMAVEGAIWRGFSFQEMLLPCGILLGVGLVTFLAGERVFSRIPD